MKVGQKIAKEFLDKINEEDVIAIFGHDDLDGFASAMLFYDFCKTKNCKEIQVHTISHGINKIADYDLKNVTKILVADLASQTVGDCLNKLSESKKILYVDHHPSPKDFKFDEKIMTLITTDLGYIPASKTVYELVGGKYWLAIAGTLSDMGEQDEINKEFIEKFLEENDISMEYMKQEIVYKLSRVIVYFEKHNDKKFFDVLKDLKDYKDIVKIFEYEEPVKKEFDKFLEDFKENSQEFGGITFYYFEPEYNIKSFLINHLSVRNPEKVLIIATPKVDLIGLSARNHSKEYDVSRILRDCLRDLKDSNTGGHKMAAGGNIKKYALEKFKENLNNYNLREAVMKDE